MRVDIWSEITCPWCGLGRHRLDRAVKRFVHRDQVDVVHRSLPLNSDLPEDRTLSVREALMAKYGVIPEQAGVPDIERMAAAEGLIPYKVLANRVGNTDRAHEFLAHASAMGRNREAWDMIFDVYFGAAQPIFRLTDLLGLAERLGLNRERTRAALTERRYRQTVHDDARRAQSLGATGDPFIVIDGRYAVPGAQDSDTLLELLQTAWNEFHPLIAVEPGDARTCGPEGCAVPVHS